MFVVVIAAIGEHPTGALARQAALARYWLGPVGQRQVACEEHGVRTGGARAGAASFSKRWRLSRQRKWANPNGARWWSVSGR